MDHVKAMLKCPKMVLENVAVAVAVTILAVRITAFDIIVSGLTNRLRKHS